jgi:membrane protease YdiL (CAAX protease family)
MNPIRDLVRRHEVTIALCLIVTINAIFVAGIATKLLPEGLYYYGRFLLLGSVLGGVVFFGSGFKGILDLLRPMAKWRIAPGWYLLVLLWPALVSILVLAGKGVLTGKGLAEIALDFSLVSQPNVARTILIGAFVGEIVWVSYAIRRLSGRFTPFVGSQIVGTVWTLWWMPMVILNVGVIPGIPPLALFLSMLGIAAMCSFIYSHTRSGIAVLALQVMVNSSALVFPVMPTSGGIPTFIAYSAAYYAAVLLLYVLFRPKPILRSVESR